VTRGAVVVVLFLTVIAGVSSGERRSAAEPASSKASAASPTTVVNPFIPEDQNLSDCVSALPRPGCGSKAQGGWRQTLVFGVVLAGLAFIGWRLVRNLRRREATAGRASASHTKPAQPGDGVRGRSPR
jgi:hypothetical protein